MKLRKVTVVLLLLALCLSLASCGSNDGLSIACVGYVKGEAGSVQNEKNGEERYILPAEFVRSFAVYTASEKGALSLETGAQVLYSYDKIYMKTLVESSSGEPQAFLSKMNEVATLAGTSLRFGSMTGLRDSEEELFEYMGKGCAFTESTGTLEDLKKAAELFKNKLLDTLEPGSYGALQTIHKHLFSDIYEFAGQTRTVNFAKGNLRFVPAMYLDAALESIEKMPQSTFDEIVEKYVEMNIAHPFQKGNGRSIRIWLDQILKKGLDRERAMCYNITVPKSLVWLNGRAADL